MMDKQELIKRLEKIDEFIYWGDRDTAHILIIKLLEEVKSDQRRIQEGNSKNIKKS